MAKRLLVPPDTLPVTLQEAKLSERIDLDDPENNEYIERLLRVATQKAEEFTRRAFITQTWIFQTHQIKSVIEVPRPPLQSVDEDTVVLLNQDVPTDIDPDSYYLDTISELGRLIFKTLPTVSAGLIFYPACNAWGCRKWNYEAEPVRLQFEFTAGYGDDPEDVPEEIREGILQIFGHLYENRESQQIPPYAKELLAPFKVWML